MGPVELAAIQLREEIKRREDELSPIRAALMKLQQACSHKWVDDGHDSHYNWERCNYCGLTQKS